jgi:hypothetical protein
MSRDINPFGVRMPPDLKEDLEKQAKSTGRSLNSEIVERLKGSLTAGGGGNIVEQNKAAYQISHTSESELQLLAIFRKLPIEKQLALISLFK